MSRLNNEQWIAQYRICSTRGTFYTRPMMLDYAARMWRGSISRLELAAVLDDDTFLRRRAGEVPEAIAKAIGFEAIARRENKDQEQRLCELRQLLGKHRAGCPACARKERR